MIKQDSKKLYLGIPLGGLFLCILLILTGCTSSLGAPAPISSTTPQTSITNTANLATPISKSSTPPVTSKSPAFTPPEAAPHGSIALFTTISGGTKSEYLRVEGENISWNSTQYKFLRYVTDMKMLHEFSWASSQSYARSYLYGITAGNWVYTVRCSIDTGTKNISRLDPHNGNTITSFPAITTESTYRGFAIVNDRIVYRTKIVKDLYDKRTGGGNIMSAAITGGNSQKLLDYYDKNNTGTYYAIGNELVSVIASYNKTTLNTYQIHSLNPETLAINKELYSFSTKEYLDFFEGETSLFWSQTDAGGTKIMRLPLSGSAENYFTISTGKPQFINVDESRGKVLISYEYDSPRTAYYNLVDMATRDVTELKMDSALFSTFTHGNQFCILD